MQAAAIRAYATYRYGNPSTGTDAFGLGYEEIDEHGNLLGPVASDFHAIRPYEADPVRTARPGNAPNMERWQLVTFAHRAP